MAVVEDKVTRVAADLLEAARVEGALSSRSAKQQLDHWARVGRAVANNHSVPRRRVEAAMRGDLSLSDLTVEEGVVFNAETSVLIAERLRAINFGATLAVEGVTTVALDEDGRMVEYRPDGSTAILA